MEYALILLPDLSIIPILVYYMAVTYPVTVWAKLRKSQL